MATRAVLEGELDAGRRRRAPATARAAAASSAARAAGQISSSEARRLRGGAGQRRGRRRGLRAERPGRAGRSAGELGAPVRLETSCSVAGAAGAGAEAEREALDDEAEAGVLGRALGLAQDARRGARSRRGPWRGRRPRAARRGPAARARRSRPRRSASISARSARARRRRGRRRREVAAGQRLDVLGVEAVHGLAEAGDAADCRGASAAAAPMRGGEQVDGARRRRRG